MSPSFLPKGNAHLINLLYSEYESRFNSEQALLSDLSKQMQDDCVRFLNLDEVEKAESTMLALAHWISRDVNFFLKIRNEKKKMYEWDMVSSLQLLGQLINICDDFKQTNIAYVLQREYSKLNIRYSIMQEAA